MDSPFPARRASTRPPVPPPFKAIDPSTPSSSRRTSNPPTSQWPPSPSYTFTNPLLPALPPRPSLATAYGSRSVSEGPESTSLAAGRAERSVSYDTAPTDIWRQASEERQQPAGNAGAGPSSAARAVPWGQATGPRQGTETGTAQANGSLLPLTFDDAFDPFGVNEPASLGSSSPFGGAFAAPTPSSPAPTRDAPRPPPLPTRSAPPPPPPVPLSVVAVAPPLRTSSADHSRTGSETIVPTHVITTFEVQLANTIKEQFERLSKAHEADLFLASSRSVADEGPTPNNLVEADPFDETTSSFISQFPALPPSPSPHSPSPVPSTSTPAKVPASTSSFTAQVESTTSILVWRLKRLVEDQVAVGEKQWREEKARAQHEYDQLDSQSEGQLEKIQRAEEELARVKEQLAEAKSAEQAAKSTAARDAMELQSLRSRLKEEQAIHSEHLEAAVAAAFSLQERVEVLQVALNEVDEGLDRRDRAQHEESDGDNVWRELVESQSEALSSHTNALAKFSTILVCPICSETITGATTLSCGHSGCENCFQGWFRSGAGHRTCPECRSPTTGVLSPAVALREVIAGLKAMGMGEEDE